MTTTTTPPTGAHRLALSPAAWAAIAFVLVAATVAAAVLWPSATAESSRPSARPANVVAEPAPVGSADVLERRVLAQRGDVYDGDSRRFGSPDAAERWSER